MPILNDIDWNSIEQIVCAKEIPLTQFSNISSVSGGDINTAFQITDDTTKTSIFIKINHQEALPIFIAETKSIEAIARTHTITTPSIIVHGNTSQHSYLAMEYLSLSAHGNDYDLGQQLAQMHKTSSQQSNGRYGFDADNYIGLTPQKNHWMSHWCDFWIEQRLMPQLQLAYQNSYHNELEPLELALLDATKHLLLNHEPSAALVHGDLWSGNKAFQGQIPVIFDPACYFADREVDIAMTKLFGGFSTDFYQGYNDTWPLEADHQHRTALYNLYHMLNHLNLFGSAYLPQVWQMIRAIQV